MTVAIALFCLLTACNEDDYVHVKFDQKTFNEQKQLWQASHTKDYEYQLFGSGFMMYDVKITVEDGNFKDEEILHEFSVSSVGSGYSTIDMIYERIEEMYKYYNGSEKSDYYIKEIKVEYDKINHIPIQINYVAYISPDLAVDGTFDYSITNYLKK